MRFPVPARARLQPLLLACSLALAVVVAHAAEDDSFPPLTGRVVDAADVLAPDTEQILSRELAELERSSGGVQVVVVTVPSLGGRAIEEYGYRLGRHWGIGQRDEDTGALLLVAPAERQVRIEVGYGLEGVLTDAVSWDIIQGRILPQFRQGNMDAGVLAGARAVIAALGGEYEPSGAGEEPGERRESALAFWILVALILLSSFGRGRRGRRRAFLGGALLGSGGGGFSGGGGGGGFRGGGGSFGGGGASGGW